MLDFPSRSVVRRARKSARTLALAGALLTAACHKKPPRVFIPPVVKHPAPAPLTLPANLNPPELSAEIESPADLLEIGSVTPEILPPPAAPAPPPARPPVVSTPKPPAPVPVAPEATPPKIVQIFPADQLRAYNSELDEILDRDQRTLEAVARRNLNPDMRDRMVQIRELLEQAKKAREQDLLTAVNLARRADTLAKDLQARLP